MPTSALPSGRGHYRQTPRFLLCLILQKSQTVLFLYLILLNVVMVFLPYLVADRRERLERYDWTDCDFHYIQEMLVSWKIQLAAYRSVTEKHWILKLGFSSSKTGQQFPQLQQDTHHTVSVESC